MTDYMTTVLMIVFFVGLWAGEHGRDAELRREAWIERYRAFHKKHCGGKHPYDMSCPFHHGYQG